MYAVLLIGHIAGAVATALIVLTASFALIVRRADAYRMIALILAAIASFEVATGTALAVASASITVASVCGNIAVYIAVVVCVEVLLYLRMKGSPAVFPVGRTVYPIGGSIALLLMGLALGF